MKNWLNRLITGTLATLTLCTASSCSPSDVFKKGPITSASINGIKLSKYTLCVREINMYELPADTAERYFDKYCNVKIKVSDNAKGVEGPKIIVGGTKADGSDYSTFEAEIYMKDGDVHLGCATPSTAQRVLYAFFAKYFNEAGKIDANIPDDGTVVYHTDEPDWDDANPALLTIQDKIVRGCYKLQEILEFDHSNGNYYTYENHGYPDTIAEARETGNRTTNCVIVGNWVMKDAGFYSSGIYNHTYDGTTGYSFSGESKAFFEENFDVIDMRDKNVSIGELQQQGKVLPGDIIGFNSHNQMIMPKGRAFDAGRGQNTEFSGRGAKFIQWLGANPYPDMTVGFIIRAKDAE